MNITNQDVEMSGQAESLNKDFSGKIKLLTILTIVFAVLFVGVSGYLVVEKCFLSGKSNIGSNGSQNENTSNGSVSDDDISAAPSQDIIDLSKIDFENRVLTETESDDGEYWFCYSIGYTGLEINNIPTISVYNGQSMGDGRCLTGDEQANSRTYLVKFQSVPYPNGIDFEESVTFESDVRTVFIGGMGQAVGDEYIIFVMADGSVKYIPAYDSAVSGKIILKDLDGVAEVIEATGAGGTSAFYAEDGQVAGYGWQTILLERLDGGVYDFGKLIEK